MDVTIPTPNQALTELMLSPRIRSIVQEIAEVGQALYREDVAKRTGRLAASARVHTEIGGVRHDRWTGVLSIGGAAGGEVLYALAHEFGVGDHPESRHDGHEQPGAEDLQRVLELLSVAGRL